jgi:peptidoglycan hydrolase-like protein with peptidoglycan-binding domain
MHVGRELASTDSPACHDDPENPMNKHKLALAVCCFAVAGLAGCGSDQNAAPPPPMPAPAPVAAATPPPPPPAPPAKPMAHQNRVATVQTALNNNGAQLDVDGHMGPKTVAALKTFQTQHHLKVTGKMNGPTAKALGV